MTVVQDANEYDYTAQGDLLPTVRYGGYHIDGCVHTSSNPKLITRSFCKESLEVCAPSPLPLLVGVVIGLIAGILIGVWV